MKRKFMNFWRLSWGWIILGSLLGIGFLLIIVLVLLWIRPPRQSIEQYPAEMNVIPLPTETLAPLAPEIPSSTDFVVLSPDKLGIGLYAQVLGTEGDGLRLRAGAGLDQEPLFLGLDGEVFLIIDGPIIVDGYTWYYLSAPYDEERKGWAVTDFLEVINSP